MKKKKNFNRTDKKKIHVVKKKKTIKTDKF